MARPSNIIQLPPLPRCPNLDVGKGGVWWTDSLGRRHDLLAMPLLSLKQAAPLFGAGRSAPWLREEIAAGRVYPVLKTNQRMIEVYQCAIADWKARHHLVGGAR